MITGAGHGWPNSRATPASAAVVTTTCAMPAPNTAWRSTQSRDGCSSRPIDEQQHHDAELREVQDAFDVGDDPQAPRPDDRAGREVTEHRAELETPEQRHRDDGGGEKHGDLAGQRHAADL